MNTTTVLPTPPTSGAIVTGGYENGYDNALAELITNNNVADNGRAILAAIANGNASIIAADQAAHLANQKATMDASVAGINATNLNGVSNIEAINRNGLAGITSTERNAGEIRMNVAKEAGESRLAGAISAGEIRELINKTGFDNIVAIKDNGFAIREEGCKTREAEAAHFAALQYQAEKNKNDIEKEMLKGFAATQLEALKNKCELEKQIAEICCCVEKDGNITRSLILAENTKRLETELQEARLKAAIAGLGTCDKGNGK